MRLIDADKLTKTFKQLKGVDSLANMFITDVVKEIHKQPTVEAKEVVHGEWIAQDEGLTKFMCSVCNGKNHGGHEKFCPDCGADMRKKVNE